MGCSITSYIYIYIYIGWGGGRRHHHQSTINVPSSLTENKNESGIGTQELRLCNQAQQLCFSHGIIDD